MPICVICVLFDNQPQIPNEPGNTQYAIRNMEYAIRNTKYELKCFSIARPRNIILPNLDRHGA